MSDSILNSHEFHESLRLGLDEAYVTLWREGSKQMVGYYIRKGFINEAEDLWSETHLKLLRTRCESFDPAKGSFEGWLFTVAKNVAVDLVRKLEQEQDTIPFEDCGYPALHDPDEEEIGGPRYLEVLVKRAEASLGPNDRTILSLRIVESLSFDAISCELGISVPAAAMRVSRALERLRIEMERLSTRELPRRIGRCKRRNSGRAVSAECQKQRESSGSK